MEHTQFVGLDIRAKIIGKRHSRRLLLAAGIMNQISAD